MEGIPNTVLQRSSSDVSIESEPELLRSQSNSSVLDNANLTTEGEMPTVTSTTPNTTLNSTDSTEEQKPWYDKFYDKEKTEEFRLFVENCHIYSFDNGPDLYRFISQTNFVKGSSYKFNFHSDKINSYITQSCINRQQKMLVKSIQLDDKTYLMVVGVNYWNVANIPDLWREYMKKYYTTSKEIDNYIDYSVYLNRMDFYI